MQRTVLRLRLTCITGLISLWAFAAAGPALSDEWLDRLQNLGGEYHVELITADPGFPVATRHGWIGGRAASAAMLKPYARLFVAEFSRYPIQLVRRTELRRVVFCGDLHFAGQRRNAVPDFQHQTLYLDVSRGSSSPTYLRKVIHHEFFHIIDWRDDGQLYADDRWFALNPAGFRYGDGGRNAQNRSTTSVLTKESPGFLNHYSTTGVEEDKAEVFANLMVEPDYVLTTAKKDPVLQAKVERMKELLELFCPEMNAAFWMRGPPL